MPHRPPRKPLLAWEALPWIVFLVLLVVGSLATAVPGGAVHVAVFVVLSVLAVAALVWGLAGSRRPGNPDRDGTLGSLEGVHLAVAPPAGRFGTPVTITSRSTMAAALAWRDDELVAVLVPRATRWLRRRYRIAVHLVARGRGYRVGLLPEQADASLDPVLAPLRERGWFVAVPAQLDRVHGRATVLLSLGAVAETAATAALAASGAPGPSARATAQAPPAAPADSASPADPADD